MTSYEVSVPYRCPFEYGPVPPLMAFRRFGLASGIKPLRNLSKFLVKVWCRGLRFPLRGSFDFHLDGQVKRITVSSHNSHFETIFAWPLGSYEPTVCALIDMLLPQQGTFFDIGANWGYYSLFVAAREGFSGDIYAFEPYPPTVRDFEEVIRQAGLSDRIHFHSEALSDHEGEATMIVPQRVKMAQAQLADVGGGLSVRTCRLDVMTLPKPDLVKLDVETHEAAVLSGARDTLSRAKPAIIMENWVTADRPVQYRLPLQILESLGYLIFVPRLEVMDSAGSRLIRMTEVDISTRADFPDVVDVCAIHKDRTDILENISD